MKNYYRIMLGQKSVHAEECFKSGYIGGDFGIVEDLKSQLPDNWREFNKKYIPVYLKRYPEKTKISAGLACGALWTISKGIQKGEIVLCPNGNGSYHIGEVLEGYSYHPGQVLPHRRQVRWYPKTLERSQMSQGLQNSSGSIGTVSTITKFGDEIERFISGLSPITIVSSDETIEDPAIFALEKHLEDFLVKNWKHTDLGKRYDIYEEDGELVGQQYFTDTGPIDILAVSKDKKELLVIELKKGRASDAVVGQVQRYMGYVLEELAEADQVVKGIIIAQEDHLTIRRALTVTTNIDFYRYQVSFKLAKI